MIEIDGYTVSSRHLDDQILEDLMYTALMEAAFKLPELIAANNDSDFSTQVDLGLKILKRIGFKIPSRYVGLSMEDPEIAITTYYFDAICQIMGCELTEIDFVNPGEEAEVE